MSDNLVAVLIIILHSILLVLSYKFHTAYTVPWITSAMLLFCCIISCRLSYMHGRSRGTQDATTQTSPPIGVSLQTPSLDHEYSDSHSRSTHSFSDVDESPAQRLERLKSEYEVLKEEVEAARLTFGEKSLPQREANVRYCKAVHEEWHWPWEWKSLEELRSAKETTQKEYREAVEAHIRKSAEAGRLFLEIRRLQRDGGYSARV
ncbi:hypothetical protein DL98DRAFT_637315 [Cadophora sp. DSE1049]|nr:hypothetical protein DL98DRAFT_637315 [Cadophora sp. DSE1049]